MELERFTQPLTPQQLEAVVIHNEIPRTQTILELPGLDRLKKKLATGNYSSSDDANVAQQIHGVFRNLDDRTMTDPQMWQWLTTTQFNHYVLDRWKPKQKSRSGEARSSAAFFGRRFHGWNQPKRFSSAVLGSKHTLDRRGWLQILRRRSERPGSLLRNFRKRARSPPALGQRIRQTIRKGRKNIRGRSP